MRKLTLNCSQGRHRKALFAVGAIICILFSVRGIFFSSDPNIRAEARLVRPTSKNSSTPALRALNETVSPHVVIPPNAPPQTNVPRSLVEPPEKVSVQGRNVTDTVCIPKGTERAVVTVWPTHRRLEDFLAGPGLNETNSTIAVCQFRYHGPWRHFAHGMQAMYRCFSWWNANSNKQPVLLFPVSSYEGIYLNSFMDAMKDAFNVSVVITDDAANYTTSVAVYPLWEQTPFPARTTRPTFGHSMRSSSDAVALRDSVLSHYKLLDNNTAGCRVGNDKALPVVGILNRQETRTIYNAELVAGTLEQTLGVQVKHASFENSTYLEQIKFMSEVDILLSPHGAQLTSIPFMPTCGAVVELTHGYHVPYFFGSLAASSGLGHSSLYTGADKNKEVPFYMRKPRRTAGRALGNCVNLDKAVEEVQRLIDQWTQCCEGNQLPV